MVTDLYPYPIEKDRRGGGEPGRFFEAFKEVTGATLVPYACARAAMVHVGRAMGLDRQAEILVPPWMGHCVLSALSRTAFPALAPSARTRAILVYHQFGFPQNLEVIEKEARKRNWYILNDCANTFLSRSGGRDLATWGDAAVFSFSKLYPCLMGGGAVSRHDHIQAGLAASREERAVEQSHWSAAAFHVLKAYREGTYGHTDTTFLVDAVFGYLPELVPWPEQALALLPESAAAIRDDAERREAILALVRQRFPERTPRCDGSRVVPFGVPVKGAPDQLEAASHAIMKKLNVCAPVMHFDFAMNMLAPDYRKAVVIGCHRGWTLELIERITDLIAPIFHDG